MYRVCTTDKSFLDENADCNLCEFFSDKLHHSQIKLKCVSIQGRCRWVQDNFIMFKIPYGFKIEILMDVNGMSDSKKLPLNFMNENIVTNSN